MGWNLSLDRRQVASVADRDAGQAAQEQAIVDHARNRRDEVILAQRGLMVSPARLDVYVPLRPEVAAAIAAQAARWRAGALEVVCRDGLAAELADPPPVPLGDRDGRGRIRWRGGWGEQVAAEGRAARQIADSRSRREEALRRIQELEAGVAAGVIGPGDYLGGRVTVQPVPQVAGVGHYFNPWWEPRAGGSPHVGTADSFPPLQPWDAVPVADPAWYVKVVEGWSTLDLEGVRVGRRQPTRYGVHDDGQCPCHSGVAA